MRIPEPYFTRGFKPLMFLLLLTPTFLLAYGYWQDSLGANPIEILRRSTGEWTLNSLLLTLLVSPLRRIIKWTQLIKLRRMLGLYTFFYACLHLITYIWLDQFFDLVEIAYDIAERPFITAGVIAFIALVPLAFTSTNRMMRKLGKNWLRLHMLIYPIAIISVVHYWWLVKADTREVSVYALILGLLFVERGWNKLNNKRI